MQAVDARIDDRHGDTGAVVSGLLLGKVHLVNNGRITVLNLENAVKFQHDDARQGGGFKDQVVGDASRNCVDQGEMPLVKVAHLTREHGDVLLGGRMVKVDDEGQRVGLIQEQRMVVVFFHHVSDFIVVFVHRSRVPPSILARIWLG